MSRNRPSRRSTSRRPLPASDSRRDRTIAAGDVLRRAEAAREQLEAGDYTDAELPDLLEARDAARAAFRELVDLHLGLVRKVCGAVLRRSPSPTVEPDDLVSEAVEALLPAARKYDPEVAEFSTYASRWIRVTAERALRRHKNLVRVPEHVHTKMAAVYSARADMALEFGREVSLEEAACVAGTIDPQLAVEVARLGYVSSLNRPARSPDGSTGAELADLLADPDSDIDLLINPPGETGGPHLVEAGLKTLPDRAAQMFRLRYGIGDIEPLTLDEIGERFNLSRERVRQILKVNTTDLAAAIRRAAQTSGVTVDGIDFASPADDIPTSNVDAANRPSSQGTFTAMSSLLTEPDRAANSTAAGEVSMQ